MTIECALQAQYSYTPFGERTKITGSGTDADFGFAGMYHHARSGLNLTLFRAYDSRLGRWLSRDPLGELMGTNLYAYVGNSPLNAVDPLGLQPTLGTIHNYVTGRNFTLEQGNNNYGLTHIQRRHGPGTVPVGNTEDRGVFTAEAWQPIFMDRMLQRTLGACPGDQRVDIQHDVSDPTRPRDIYTFDMGIVTRDAQTGSVIRVNPLGYVYGPDIGAPRVPLPTFRVRIVVNALTNNIISIHPIHP